MFHMLFREGLLERWNDGVDTRYFKPVFRWLFLNLVGRMECWRGISDGIEVFSLYF